MLTILIDTRLVFIEDRRKFFQKYSEIDSQLTSLVTYDDQLYPFQLIFTRRHTWEAPGMIDLSFVSPRQKIRKPAGQGFDSPEGLGNIPYNEIA
jgi:hypothetical protein